MLHLVTCPKVPFFFMCSLFPFPCVFPVPLYRCSLFPFFYMHVPCSHFLHLFLVPIFLYMFPVPLFSVCMFPISFSLYVPCSLFPVCSLFPIICVCVLHPLSFCVPVPFFLSVSNSPFPVCFQFPFFLYVCSLFLSVSLCVCFSLFI